MPGPPDEFDATSSFLPTPGAPGGGAPPKRLLIITYEFPPSGGVAVQRALSFAKYLPEHGFEVHVLTAANPASPVFDPGLSDGIPASVTVHRAWTAEPSYGFRQRLWRTVRGEEQPRPAVTNAPPSPVRFPRRVLARVAQRFLSPDPHILWYPIAYPRAVSIIKKFNIDTVLTTAPPFSVFVIANRLKKRFPHLRMIADFRDEWRRYFLADFEFLRNRHAERAAERIERETVHLSSLVLAATRTSLEEIRRGHPESNPGKFAVISNGYDPARFTGFAARPHNTGKLVVTYVGTVYKVCSPRYYFEALDRLPAAVRSCFHTRFVGRIIEEERPIVEGRAALELLGFRPQSEAFRWMEETDFLLVTVTNDFAIAGKLFEYLATGKPILAISPTDGEVARVVRESGMGWCAPPDDIAAIERMLLMAYEMWRNQRPMTANVEVLRRYARPALAERLAALLRAT